MICNISLTNFVPPISSHIKHQIYIIHIKSSYQIPGIKAYRVTTSNSGNFKVLCNIPLTNFVPFTSSHNRHQIVHHSYQIFIFRILQIKAFRVTTSNSGTFRIICNISLANFVPSAFNQIRHHKYISFI